MNVRGVRAVLAAGLLGSALHVMSTSAAPGLPGDVQVRGGGTLRGDYPPGTTAWRGPTERDETPYGPDRFDPTHGSNAAPPGEASPTFPADPPHDPGTIYSVAGGDCEGFPALDATVRPYRIAYDELGTLFFLDTNKRRGSVLIRYVDRAGRIRTLAPLFGPEEGRRDRGSMIPDRTVLVPDDRGGVYVNRNAGYPPHFRTEPSMDDVPSSNDIEHIAADGTRTLVVGGLPRAPNTPDFGPGAGDGDPVTRTALGELQAFTVDSWGGVYLVDIPGLGRTSRLRYANRTREARTFFPGTEDEVTVEPGTIGTIGGGAGLPLPGVGDVVGGPLEQRVSETVLNIVPKLIVRGGVLYYATTRWDGTAAFRSQPAIVAAINLFDETPVVVNGQAVRPGYSHVIAGDRTRSSGYSGDGGPAILAQLAFDHDSYTGDIAVVPNGDVYISDTRNHRVRRVDGLGIITTVAGTGMKGPAQRSPTLALASPLWYPLGIDAHPDGGVAFADYSNARVRRLTPDGFLVHEAGRGPYPCGADGDYATGKGVYGGHAFRSITDVATDSKGRTYVADAGYKVIRRIDRSGRVGLTIGRPQPCMSSVLSNYEFPADVASMYESCPNGAPPLTDMPLATASFAMPNYVLVDAYDNLFVSDLDAIRYVNLGKVAVPVLGKIVPPLSVATLKTFGTRQVHVDVGGGPLDELFDDLPPLPIGEVPSVPRIRFDFTMPLGELAIDDDGSLYIADQLLNVVYRIGPCDDLEVVVGNGVASVRGDEGDGGPATAASVHPTALALDRDKDVLYVVDSVGDQSRVRAVNRGRAPVSALGRDLGPGRIDTVVGAGTCRDGVCSAGDGSPAREALLDRASIELRPDGGLVLGEEMSHRVRLVDPTDGVIYGVLGPWPESGGEVVKQAGDMPAGWLGDGGPALAAWTSGVQTFVAGGPYNRMATALTPDDGLLVADGIGRLRRVDGLTNAPRRTGRPVLGVPNAGRGFSDTIVLDDGDTVGTGPARPVVVAAGAATYVLAARGGGNGCFLWSVATDADGRGRDAATPRGAVGPRPEVRVGGRWCAFAATPDGLAALTTVRPRDNGPLAREAALFAASSADGGASWTGAPTALPERLDATGDDEVALAAHGSTVSAAYTGADGAVHVADSVDGAVYSAVGSFTPDHVAIGDYLHSANGQRLLGLVTRQAGVLNVTYDVALATSGDGRSWVMSNVAPVAAPEITSRPAVAVAPSGRTYVAWSDGTDVRLAWSDDLRSWASPLRIPGGSVNANPSLAVDAKGTVVVGYAGTPMPRMGNVRNPYAQWYAYAAVGTPERGFTAHLASDAPVHRGALCYGDGCQGTYFTTAPVDETQETFREAGRVRVLLRPNGDLHLVTAMTANTGNNRSTTRAAIGHLRACRDLGLHGSSPRSRCALATGGSSLRAPLPVPVPTAPSVPGISPCSPAPPAFPEPAPASPPAGETVEPETPRAAGPVIPFLPLLPPPPAFPAANAPINAAQNARALEQSSQQQTSSQGQYGAAENEDEQPELALLGAAAVLSAAAAAAHRTQQSSRVNRSEQ